MMLKFGLGVIILVFSLVLGLYRYHSMSAQMDSYSNQLEDAASKRDQGKELQKRIVALKRLGLENENASQKFNLERMLDIGAPGLEWKFIGPALVRGSNRALFRYTFRISGPSTYPETQALLERMVGFPGFVPYRVCFACSPPPRGTPPQFSMVQIEGYVYAFDPATFY